MTTLLLAVLMTAADPDAGWDSAAESAMKDRKCAAKKADEVCAYLAAFRKGALPPPLQPAQFGLAQLRNVSDGKPASANGDHLVVGSAPLLAFVVKPENPSEAKQQVDLAAAYWMSKAAPKGTEELVAFLKAALKPGESERATRTEWIRNPRGPGGVAVRIFEKRLYVLRLDFEGSYEKAPSLTIAAMGLSTP